VGDKTQSVLRSEPGRQILSRPTNESPFGMAFRAGSASSEDIKVSWGDPKLLCGLAGAQERLPAGLELGGLSGRLHGFSVVK